MGTADLLSRQSGLEWRLSEEGIFVARLDRGSVVAYECRDAGRSEWRSEMWNAGAVVGYAHADCALGSYCALVAALPPHWQAWLAQQCGPHAASREAHARAVGIEGGK